MIPRLKISCWTALLGLTAAAAMDGQDYPQIGKDKHWNEPRPDMPDLSVQFISRSPRLPGVKPEYVVIDNEIDGQGESGPVKIKNPKEAGWPAPGQEVTYSAVVRNVGTQPVASFDWAWVYDGRDLQIGRHERTLVPDEVAKFTLVRSWEDGPHNIAFQVDRDRLVDEISAENNCVIDRTDALSLAFFAEESVIRFFTGVQGGLNSYSFEDWAQFQVRQMNKEFRDSVYPSCPDGILERVRLDRVYRIPDGWGNKGGMHTPNVLTPVNLDEPRFVNGNNAVPDVASEVFSNLSGGVDGVWGFAVDLLEKKPEWNNQSFYESQHRWLTGSEWPLHHELGHQLGRADHYLLPNAAGANMAMPGLAYEPPADYRASMMYSGNSSHDDAIGKNREKWDSTYRFYCEHEAASFNRDKGKRRGLFGEYLFDVPKSNRFRVLGPDQSPVANALVEIFVSKGRGYANPGFNQSPNYSLKTDAAGRLILDRNPWNHVFIWASNGVLLFRTRANPLKPQIAETPSGADSKPAVDSAASDPPNLPATDEQDPQWMVGFLDISQFNLAVWRGHADAAEYCVLLKPWPQSR